MSVVIQYDSSNKILYEQAVPDNKRKYFISLYLCGIQYPIISNGSFVGNAYTKFSVKVKLKDIDENESIDYVVQLNRIGNQRAVSGIGIPKLVEGVLRVHEVVI